MPDDDELDGACYKCGRELDLTDYGTTLNCGGCDEDTRICRNCKYYAPQYRTECSEERAELIKTKDRTNHCDYFRPGHPKDAPTGEKKSKRDNSGKDAFNRLFKKDP